MDASTEHIAELAEAAASSLELIEAVLKLGLRHTDATAGSFARHDRGAREIEFLLAVGEQQGQEPTHKRFPVDHGVVGYAIERDRSELVNTPAEHPRFFSAIDRFSGFSTENLLVLPLHLRGHVVGALSLINKPGGFAEKDREQIVALAGALEQQLATRADAAELLLVR